MANWAAAVDDINHNRGEDFFPDPETISDCNVLQANLQRLNERASMWDYRRNNGNKTEKANAGHIFGVLRNNIERYTAVIERDCFEEEQVNNTPNNNGNTNTSNTVVLTENPPKKANDIVNSTTQTANPAPVSNNKTTWQKHIPVALGALAGICVIAFVFRSIKK